MTIAATFAVGGCNADLGPSRPRLEIVAGDGQHALAGTELPDVIVVQLRDASQRPLAGVRVRWSAQPGATDVISPASNATDANGEVSARWLLDATAGAHLLVVTADGGARARATAIAEEKPISGSMRSRS